jgi:Flp pilus assembly protein TadD
MRAEPQALHRLALTAHGEGDHQRAATLLREAIDGAPGSWLLHSCLGNVCKAQGLLEEAIASHTRAVELAGAQPEAWSNLGLAYQAGGPARAEEALLCLSQAVKLAPEVADLHGNLAGALLEAGRFAEAESAALRALALDGRHVRAETNLGIALKEQGRVEEAEACFRRAVANGPEDGNAHWNLGLTWLLQGGGGARPPSGEGRNGWRELEWRHQLPGLRVPAPAGQEGVPLWGGEELRGRTVLLQSEQGLGDTIQFIRYARDVKGRGAGRVIVECHPPLERLLAGCEGVDVVAPRGRAIPPVDLRAPLSSLPLCLHGDAAPGPKVAGAYLAADAERARRWASRFSSPAPFNIGIAWQGNPRYRADRRRSIPLTAFIPLLQVARRLGVGVYSLQKGFGRDQLRALPPDLRVHDLGAELDADDAPDSAFLDTAAAMTALDLVITSDTSIPHLAGALGTPVWLLLAHLPDWRWGRAGEECHWYPSMRLFRQAHAGDWVGVFQAVASALSGVAQKSVA